MKSTAIYIGLALAICISLFFVYQRSFVTQDFVILNSEEEGSGEEMLSTENEIELETESSTSEEESAPEQP